MKKIGWGKKGEVKEKNEKEEENVVIKVQENNEKEMKR